ncbi:MAG: hypothetical protein OXC00_04475, partial [Acidimicrobiaceae bacterium]|nr:hypothetical protein [Acidimicrobiaceae bacterium]
MRAVETRLAYRELNHERLPHVVRFSGGRSSALMALRLACDGVLLRGAAAAVTRESRVNGQVRATRELK